MKFGILVISVFFILPVFGQQHTTFTPPVTGNSPNVAAFNRYGNYDVSHFTGVPNISIPVYSISVNGLNVPISLSYHASGIKVSDVASWAGLGWSLSAGGQVSRKLMGKPDEWVDHYLDGSLREYSEISTPTASAIEYYRMVNERVVDAEPDIFSYSFAGQSGKFFFNQQDNFNAALVPFAPIKISKDRLGPQADTLAFTIVDERGNRYLFGYSERELTTTLASSSVSHSAWMLEKMISADNADTIYFSYATQSGIAVGEATSKCKVNDYPTSNGNYAPSNLSSQIFPCEDGASVSNTIEKVLKEIKFRNGKIEFELSSSNRQDFGGGSGTPKSLNRVLIYSLDPVSGSYSLIKVVKLFQSYFINGSNNATKRLRLDSVSIGNSTNILNEVHRFEYNNTVALPGQYSKMMDYWGYYNGKNNSSLVPRTQIDYKPGVNAATENIYIGSDIADGREVDTAFTQAWILNKIIFPTGGYTTFEYESNKYLDGSTLKKAGGLRVKSIKSYTDPGAVPVTKTYTYGQNGSGGGRANFILNTHVLSETMTYEEFCCAVPPWQINNTLRVRTYLSTPSYDMQEFSENAVVYPYVTEYFGAPLDNKGKVEYEYRDYADLFSAMQYVRPKVISYVFDRGQVKNKKTYKNTGGAYQIVKEEVFSYSAFPQKSYEFAGLMVKKKKYQFLMTSGAELNLPASDPNYNGIWEFSYYPVVSDDNYLISKVVKDYDENDITRFATTTTTYAYNNIKHQQVNEITLTNSKGDVARQKNKYPADYLVGTNTTTGNAVADDMMAKNIIAPIETWSTLTQSGVEKTSQGVLNVYRKFGTHAIVPDKNMRLELSAPVTDFQVSSISASVLQKDTKYQDEVMFDSYDTRSNLLQYHKSDNVNSGYIWDYSSSYPIAQVVNAAVTDIAHTSFEADGKGNWTFSGSPAADPTAPTGKKAYTLGSSITKSGLNASATYIVSYWKKSGTVAVNGTTPITGKTINGWTYYEHTVASPAGGLITVSGTSGVIDELRLYPAGAQMTTYTYEPLIGMTSQCDAGNRITYYEYDGFGRLKTIRDQDKNVIKTLDYQYQKPITQ